MYYRLICTYIVLIIPAPLSHPRAYDLDLPEAFGFWIDFTSEQVGNPYFRIFLFKVFAWVRGPATSALHRNLLKMQNSHPQWNHLHFKKAIQCCRTAITQNPGKTSRLPSLQKTASSLSYSRLEIFYLTFPIVRQGLSPMDGPFKSNLPLASGYHRVSRDLCSCCSSLYPSSLLWLQE